jgi:hypothetical protein
VQKLTYKWSKRENDYLINYPRKCDGHLLYGFFEGCMGVKEFLAELEKRGYDLKTLKFEIKEKEV